MILDIEKERIIEFINKNDLDINIINDNISGFKLSMCDNYVLTFHKNENDFILIRTNPNNKWDNPNQYEYYTFKTLTNLLEQIKSYDDSIPKNWWKIVVDTCEIGLYSLYDENWHFINSLNKSKFRLENINDEIKYIKYIDYDYKPELKHPSNNLHLYSPLNKEEFTKLDRLEFEIHPISCKEGSESYLFKVLCNKDEIFKEYINYIVNSKKGFKIFSNTLFEIMKPFKI